MKEGEEEEEVEEENEDPYLFSALRISHQDASSLTFNFVLKLARRSLISRDATSHLKSIYPPLFARLRFVLNLVNIPVNQLPPTTQLTSSSLLYNSFRSRFLHDLPSTLCKPSETFPISFIQRRLLP